MNPKSGDPPLSMHSVLNNSLSNKLILCRSKDLQIGSIAVHGQALKPRATSLYVRVNSIPNVQGSEDPSSTFSPFGRHLDLHEDLLTVTFSHLIAAVVFLINVSIAAMRAVPSSSDIIST